MNAHGRNLIAGVLVGLSIALAGSAAAQDDEIVVYGKRPAAAAVELDPTALRVDVDDHRRRVAANLEASLSGTQPRPESRVATTGGRTRG